MKSFRSFNLNENQSSLSEKDRNRLDRIEKNSETFVSQFKELANKGKADKFLDHYNVLMYIQEEPDLMASILLPLLDNKEFTEWISANVESFPDTFKESMGVASDLKNLGF